MATYGRTLRRGLPRQSGGEPWPPADVASTELQDGAAREPAPEPAPVGAPGDRVGTTTAPPPVDLTATPAADAPVTPAVATTPRTTPRALRRGLPRVAGGEPWPPAGNLPTPVPSAPEVHERGEAGMTPAPAVHPVEQPEKPTVAASANQPAPRPEPVSPTPATAVTAGSMMLRRGLPRVPGGEPWPPETAVSVQTPPSVREQAETPAAPEKVEITEVAPAASTPAASVPAAAAVTSAPAPATPPDAAQAPLPQRPADREEPKPRKSRSRTANLLLGVVGLLVLAVAAVLFTRWFVTLGFMQDFLTRYPGETELPAGNESGFPAWVQWQHFFNFFLIVLIIRSGLQVRRETRPPGYWTPRWSKGGNGKISINLWFHQSLDILWLLNGLVFVVLLFVTGHWARLVPTTWEVFPNALSALIQYVSLDWPTENGWVNYNSLQMLAYFFTVFIAAPLAALSGARMSGIWPKEAKTVNRIYPVEWARAIHFPVMLYFVVFIIGHIALVFATGALRNLNHMYGGQDAVNWTGFWIFFVSLLLVIGAWIAARPVLLAPVAGLTGRVSSR